MSPPMKYWDLMMKNIYSLAAGAPLDVEDWDAELAGSALGGPEALTAQSTRDFGHVTQIACAFRAAELLAAFKAGGCGKVRVLCGHMPIQIHHAQIRRTLRVAELHARSEPARGLTEQRLTPLRIGLQQRGTAAVVAEIAGGLRGERLRATECRTRKAPMNCARSRWISTTRMTGPSSR